MKLNIYCTAAVAQQLLQLETLPLLCVVLCQTSALIHRSIIYKQNCDILHSPDVTGFITVYLFLQQK